MDRSECHKGAERKDAAENWGERGGGGKRERKQVQKGVCNGSPLNYCIWTPITLIDMHQPLVGKWDSCSLQPCLASKWQSKTMSFRSYKSGWGESPTGNFHAELFRKGNRLTSQHHRWNACLPNLLWSSQPRTFTVMTGSVPSPPSSRAPVDNHPTYPVTIPSLIIFKLISKTRAIWVSA